MGTLSTFLPLHLRSSLDDLQALQQLIAEQFKETYPVGIKVYWTTYQSAFSMTVHHGVIEGHEMYGTDPHGWRLRVINDKSKKINVVKLDNRPVPENM